MSGRTGNGALQSLFRLYLDQWAPCVAVEVQEEFGTAALDLVRSAQRTAIEDAQLLIITFVQNWTPRMTLHVESISHFGEKTKELVMGALVRPHALVHLPRRHRNGWIGK